MPAFLSAWKAQGEYRRAVGGRIEREAEKKRKPKKKKENTDKKRQKKKIKKLKTLKEINIEKH